MDYFASTSVLELERLIDSERDNTIRQRLLIMWHTKKGATQREIEGMFRMPQSTVNDWIQRFRRHGIKGLYRKPGSGGHNRYLTRKQEKGLVRKLKHTPMTTKMVGAYIRERYGKEYHPNSISRLLRRLGSSLITARPRHIEADTEKQEAFREHIKKDT
ncbi:MAG: winged helix-turn-helix domain-containing protein [Candidatus Aenigmatarchaeota archaeon]